jgi:hypothetical protein
MSIVSCRNGTRLRSLFPGFASCGGGWLLFGLRAAEREEDTLTGARSEQTPDARRLSDPEKADVERRPAPAAWLSALSGSHGACSVHRHPLQVTLDLVTLHAPCELAGGRPANSLRRRASSVRSRFA